MVFESYSYSVADRQSHLQKVCKVKRGKTPGKYDVITVSHMIVAEGSTIEI